MDHDQRFKTLIQTFFADFLRLALGEADAARYDCTQPEWLTQEIFADPPQGERREIDLAARLPVNEPTDDHQRRQPQPWLVLVHAEIESADTVVPLRKRVYDYRHELRRKYQIPVKSIALYLSVGLEGIGWDTYTETEYGEEVLRFRFQYLGLPALEAFDYVNGANLLGVGMSSLMRVAADREAELKAEALQRLFEADLPALQRYLLVECVEAYLPLVGPQVDEFDKRLLTPKFGGAMKVAKTSRELGREEGRGELIIQTLQRKFGAIPPTVIERVQAMNSNELVELNIRIGSVGSLRELFLEPDGTEPV